MQRILLLRCYDASHIVQEIGTKWLQTGTQKTQINSTAFSLVSSNIKLGSCFYLQSIFLQKLFTEKDLYICSMYIHKF